LASGTQIGVDPVPYRLDYTLVTTDGWVTRHLDVVARGEGWRRHLDLRSDGRGGWEAEVEHEGAAAPALLDVGGDLRLVAGALDCDLARSPLTNTMPILRHRLDREPGAADLIMAWVRVPDLSVHPSRQRYEHVRADAAGAVVRYVGAHRDVVSLLELDADGLVRRCPDLAARVEP
jgi:hypothetical protein